MTPIDFATSAARYAVHALGVRRSYDLADAYAVGRFTHTEEPDAYPWARRVPAVAHVWEHLILPTLDPVAPINDAAVRDSLDTLPRRYDGGQGRRSPLPGREHLVETRDATRDLTPYYAGLYAALHMHPVGGNDFDRAAYLADLLAYGHAHRARTLTPATTSTRRVRAHRARKADGERAAVLDAFDAALDAGDIPLGEPITRAALAEAIGLELDAKLSDRRIFEVLRSADDLGVDAPLAITERQPTVVIDGARTRTRVFVFTETTRQTTTTDQTEEAPVSLTEQTDAMHRAADAADRLTASLERLQRQHEQMLSGDRLGALQTQRDGLTAPPAPIADLGAYRARRAA